MTSSSSVGSVSMMGSNACCSWLLQETPAKRMVGKQQGLNEAHHAHCLPLRASRSVLPLLGPLPRNPGQRCSLPETTGLGALWLPLHSPIGLGDQCLAHLTPFQYTSTDRLVLAQGLEGPAIELSLSLSLLDKAVSRQNGLGLHVKGYFPRPDWIVLDLCLAFQPELA